MDRIARWAIGGALALSLLPSPVLAHHGQGGTAGVASVHGSTGISLSIRAAQIEREARAAEAASPGEGSAWMGHVLPLALLMAAVGTFGRGLSFLRPRRPVPADI